MDSFFTFMSAKTRRIELTVRLFAEKEELHSE